LQRKADTLAGVCGALLAVREKKRNAAMLVMLQCWPPAGVLLPLSPPCPQPATFSPSAPRQPRGSGDGRLPIACSSQT